MAMLVLDDADPSLDFQFSTWILYDPRPSPGQHYLALMNEANEPICEGYYLSLLLNSTAPIALSCFDRHGRGKIRFDGLQKEGNFSGETSGTGFLSTNKETVLFVHGPTIEEAKNASFEYLWNKYGGRTERELGLRESAAKRVFSAPKSPTRSLNAKPVTKDLGDVAASP